MALLNALCGCCLFASFALLTAHTPVLCDNDECPLDADETHANTTEKGLLMQRMIPGSWMETARAAIVSASYGGRAAKTRLPRCPQDVRCVWYTDSHVDDDGGWMVSTEPYHEHSERFGQLETNGRHSWHKIESPKVRSLMAAKFYKMNMFWLPELAGVNVILWHDAEWVVDWFHPTVSLADRMVELVQGHPMVLEKHYQRHTVAAEMQPAIERARDSTGDSGAENDIHEAYEHFNQKGFTDNALFNGARFLIDANFPHVREAMLGWWREVQDFTFRDQISLPFIVQHFNLPVKVLKNRDLHKMILGDIPIALGHKHSQEQRDGFRIGGIGPFIK